MAGKRAESVWLLTDRRYLGQRMPLALADWLDAAGCPVRLVVAEEATATAVAAELPSMLSWDGLARGDLVVTRSRSPYALALLQVAEALRARTIDSWAAVSAVRDKMRCSLALARRGIPIPPTFLARRPRDLEQAASSAFPLILKPVLGDNGRGLRLVADPAELAAVEWREEPVLAQSYLDADGVDLKVYVAGDAIWAVRRPSPLVESSDAPVPVRVTTTIRDLVAGCRAEFGLQLFGLDVLELASGPVVVDVNEFPNYTGVEEAPAAIGRLLLGMTAPRATAAGKGALVRT
jgi:ribosomal protein S6--L-glutamate ligase